MARKLRVGAAQIGGVSREESREHVVERHIALLEEAAHLKVDLVAYPECSLTPFFTRWIIDDQGRWENYPDYLAPCLFKEKKWKIDEKKRWSPEIDKFFEKSMPNPIVQPLFDRAKDLGTGFALGYAELDGDKHYNSYILIGKDGKIIGKYRKSHMSGTVDHILTGNLIRERRYFLYGDTGFKVWPAFGGVVGMMICADRSYPETFFVLALQGAEVVLVPLASTFRNPLQAHASKENTELTLRMGALSNGVWVVGTAHGGEEDGVFYLSQSMIVSPHGEVVARTYSPRDELITYTIDLDEGKTKREQLMIGRRTDLFKQITDRYPAKLSSFP